MTAATATVRPAAGMAGSPLVRSGGWRVERLLAGPALAALAAEAEACHRGAVESVVDEPRDDDPRGGHPDRRLETAAGGPALGALYASPVLHRLLARLTGTPWRPSGPRASYSYYRAPRHHLGLHRDVDVCALAVIACVADGGATDAGAAALHVYPSRAADALADVRADRRGAVAVPVAPGQAVVLLGGIVPHEVRPVGPGRCRVVAPMCFRPAV
ncbi:MAG TPA: hypothetical protein VM263_06080 [Acidimicrobiales bacterium]|nr:hypothetical protein [Acidimicrobiales bacterium]